MGPPKLVKPITSTSDLPSENPFRSSSNHDKKPRKIERTTTGTSGKPISLDSNSPVVLVPPPLFPVGYKTPLSLLGERCQKMGWEKPIVDPRKLPSGAWTASVTLKRKNAKTGALDSVRMQPPPAPSPMAVEKETGTEAKHYASVYALFRFANNLSLNLQLPPQTRDYWNALKSEKASSPPNKVWLWSITPFETALEAPPPPSSSSIPSHLTNSGSSTTNSPFSSNPPSASTSRSATPTQSNSSRSDKHWSEAPEVRMPSALRDLVEETIRSMMIRFPSALPSEFSDLSITTPSTLEDQPILLELTQMGFRKGHTSAAISYVQSARNQTSTTDPLLRSMASLPLRLAVLEYLHLHTPEEDLPASFRTSRPADSNARVATNTSSEALAISWKTEALAKETGMPIPICEKAMRDAGDDEDVAVDLMVRRLMGWSEGEEGGGEMGLSDSELLSELEKRKGGNLEADDKELQERRNDELEGLEGIFGDMCRRTEKGIEILVSSNKKRNQNSTHDQVILRVLFHQHSLYPSPSEPDEAPHIPTFYVYSSTLPAYIRLHLTALIASQFTLNDQSWIQLAQSGFGGIVCEMTNHLQEVWQEAVENPPDSRQVMSKLLGSRLGPSVESVSKKKEVKKTIRRAYRPPATPQAHAALLKHLELNSKRVGYAGMLAVREKLPAWSMKQEIVDLIRDNRVVIVSGETGSGKTTQVPSFVIDDAISRGEGANINIIVTQPRRVSAIGVATRVAAERLEDINDPNSRFLIGYAIRGERKASKECRVLFCTTGVILSRLSRGGDPDLAEVSHIFIDEVHERSVDSDFLLLELRDILKRNKKLKVVLMSATINQAQFSNYYGGAPCIEIPGFTHPVQDHYLEEILPNLANYQASSKPAVKKATQAQLERMKESFISRGVTNERTLMTLESLTRSERIDFSLVGATTAYCLQKSQGSAGGVLVFMPGVFEIKQAVDAIRAACPSSEKIEVFPLHANLSSQEQTAVFRPVKAGHRKVVVATNVAETSITIDGIVYVIDCGRVKENTFDPETGIVKLVETWTSKAASKQRRGRAGRTRPGECFKLFTHYTEETVMAPHPTPEIVRIPLEMLCLQIKAMREDEDVKTFLGKALDPPDIRAIDSAWETLRLLGAIEEEGGTAARLTPLGAHLAMIPVDLRLGKMLVLASIFRCLDPILTVVALLSSKPFFLSPMDKKEESKKARSMFYTSRSDLLSDVKAYEACLAARSRSNYDLRTFAEENYISLSTFRDVQNLRNDYLTALSDVGFIPFRASSTSPGLNENSMNENLLKTCIFAGTSRLVKVKLPATVFDKGLSGAIERDRLSKEVKFYEKDGRVFLHPGSLLFTENRYATPYLTYWSKYHSTKPFLRDATEVPLYGVLLFGAKVRVDLQKGLTIGDDNWLMMRAWPRIGVLVNSLRRLFDADLERNIESPDFEGGSSPVVNAMLALLEKDGGIY